jgi:16S rRNA (uracil1498-N3)-methyltransferase
VRNIRVYVNQPLSLGQPVILEERPAHHLGHVLRLRPRDLVHAFNGRGGCYVARIDRITRREVAIVPTEYLDEERESALNLILAHGIARGQRMDYTIQKAVELGVNRIVPVLTEHAQVKLGAERLEKRLSHWHGVIISACEQCGRNRLPDMETPLALADWAAADDNEVKLLLQPGAGPSPGSLDIQPAAVTLLCGPEGGLSEYDCRLAEEAGYRAVSLGPRTLRTETAAVAALAVCQALWGDLR